LARPRGLVVYMSDFGWSDPYAGIVRGVVETLSGGRVKLIDLTHDVPSFSVLAGAYVLYTSYRWFPEGTVFLAVVDPGVGTERKPVAIETRRYFFVGPDNGLLYPAAAEDGIVRVHAIDSPAVHLKPVSMGFHGRDIFAPAAALLALGTPIEAMGTALDPAGLQRLSLRRPCEAQRVEAQVVYIDHFGNTALGLEPGCVEKLCSASGRIVAAAGHGRWEARCRSVFSHGEPGELVFYLNSLGFPELAVNLGSAAKELGLEVGDMVILEPA